METVNLQDKNKTTQETQDASLLKKIVLSSYTFFAYGFSMAALVYFIVFAGDYGLVRSINAASPTTPTWLAIVINIGLLLLFGLQHSVMARKSFKQKFEAHFEPAITRATYCLATGLVIFAIGFFWVPIEGVVWQAETSTVTWIIYAISILGWTGTVIATFQLDHFELFGLKQVYYFLSGKPVPSMTFKSPGMYKWVRHPIQTTALIGLWFAPVATWGFLMLAIGVTIYVMIGLYFEEKDLIKEFGNTYLDYKKQVGKLLPKLF